MSVRAGREFLAIPGPTTVPDEVLRAMHRPAVEIYSGPLLALTEGLMRDVARVFNTKGRAYIYAANGHGAWEAALTNVLSRGDRILVLESGRFAINWGEHARRMGAEVEVLKGDMRHAVRPAEVEARLKADRKSSGGTFKAVLVAQIDTASGVVNDIPAIGQAIRAAGHDALLMVDAVASLGCMPFDMDDWGVDVAMSGSQKGLMAPPGLGFVAANERAREAHKQANLRTPYWDWTERDGEQHYQKYAGTPPEHLLYALRQALDLMFEEGLPNVFHRHRLLAEAVRRAVTVWAEGQVIGFNVIEPGERCAFRMAGAAPRRRSTGSVSRCQLNPAHTSSRYVPPSRTRRPAVAPAKCVPITSTGVPASRSNIVSRVRCPCTGSESAVDAHSGCAI
jgi:alanine-glyoxylate transaminase/serine-glyoxylate transaminase/serine-pyruvate transaminase